MTGPFTLARRMALIVIVALLALWLGLVINTYIRTFNGADIHRPSPARVGAIYDAVSHTPENRRKVLLAALTSPTVEVVIASEEQLAFTQETREYTKIKARESDEALLHTYRKALPNLSVSIFRYRTTLLRNGLPRIGWVRRQVIEVRIPLHTGDILVIRNRSLFSATPFGAPVGLAGGLLGTIIAFIALLAMYRELRPLAHLARAVNRFDFSGDPIPLPQTNHKSPELSALFMAFDRLQTRLTQVLRARFLLIAGISHDVRTFATRLRLRVEAIPDEPQRHRAIHDITDMIRLLDDALLASRAGSDDLSEELLDLSEFIQAECADRREAGLPVTLLHAPAAQPIQVLADRLALRRVIDNLIENAVKYGDAARIRISVSSGMAFIDVEDNGPGLPVDLMNLLTEPFVRGETSRNRETGGAGLGLSVARALVEAHGGNLSILNGAASHGYIRIALPLFAVIDD